MSKKAIPGTLVKIFGPMKNSLAIVARVQAHLAMQFTYSRSDDDDIIGICRFDGDFEDDYTTDDSWKPKQETEEGESESRCEDSSRLAMVDRPWMQPGRRRRKTSARTV